MHRLVVAASLSLLLALPAAGDVVEETVDYELPTGEVAEGVMVYDDDVDEPRPGVLVIPEWWGLTDYPVMRARKLAEEGYVAFVADMYGGGEITGEPSQAQRMSGEAYQFGLAKLAKPALDQLMNSERVDGTRVAAIGFCFGGSTVVEMARSDYAGTLSGVVSFHGGLSKETAPQGDYIGPPMLLLHGGADPMVKPDAFGGFVQQAIAAGVPVSIVSFPDAVHAFSNPEADAKAEEHPQLKGAIAFDERATEVSLAAMDEFFELVLGDFDD